MSFNKALINTFPLIYPKMEIEPLEKRIIKPHWETLNMIKELTETEKKQIVGKITIKELRELAKESREKKLIFKNYTDYEIERFNRRQLEDMLKTQEKYIKIRKEE